MVQSIKGLLHIRNLEDFKGIEYVFDSLIIGFLLFLSFGAFTQRILVHLLLLFWISINTCQLCTIFKRKKCEHIFLQAPITTNHKVLFLLITSSIENLAFLIFSVVHMVCFMNRNLLEAILFSIVHVYFAMGLGMLVGSLCKSSIALIIISLFYGRCFFNSWWTSDEPFRFVSPTLQLYNVHVINVTNICSLALITVICIIGVKYLLERHERNIKLKVSLTLCIAMILFGALIGRELRENKRISDAPFNIFAQGTVSVSYRGINQKTAQQLSNILSHMEDELQSLNIVEKSNDYVFNKYYVSKLYSLYKTRPIPITKENDTIYINVFSDGMINLNESAVLQDFLYRSYTQMVRKVIAQDNNYTYQIIEGCKMGIFRRICRENQTVDAQDLQELYDSKINLNLQSQVTPSNYIKIISSYMYQQDPVALSELYTLVSTKQIESDEAFIQLFEKNFPQMSNTKEMQLVLTAMCNNE